MGRRGNGVGRRGRIIVGKEGGGGASDGVCITACSQVLVG